MRTLTFQPGNEQAGTVKGFKPRVVEKTPLPHRGLEPASGGIAPDISIDALPTELSPPLFWLVSRAFDANIDMRC